MRFPPLIIAVILAAVSVGINSVSVQAATLDLPSRALVIELARCRVDISITADQNPGLDLSRIDGSDISIESAGVRLNNNTLTVRAEEEQDQPSDLVVSITLQPGQHFQIDGTDLDLTVTGPGFSPDVPDHDWASDEEAPDSTAECAIPRLLNLVGGTAHLVGGGCTTIVSTSTDLILEQGSQTLEVQAIGGRIDIREHRGNIILEGRDHFHGVIVDHEGDLDLSLSQGQILVEGGTGRISCQGDHFGLHLTERRGSLDATGTAGAFMVDHSEMERTKIHGIRSIGNFSSGQGRIQATMEGGRLSVNDWAGRIDLQSSLDTTIEIENLDGDFAFSITDGAGEITDITGHTRGTLANSKISFSRLKSIEVTARNSETSIEDVPQLIQMNILGGHLNLENSEIAGTPKIQLSDEATADIEIPQPCIVRFSGPGSKDSGNMSVSGCEVRAPNQPWGKRHRNSEPAIQLEVTMRRGSEVFVSGY